MATAPLVSIKNVKASQVVNDVVHPLISGTLLLTEPLATTQTDAKLFITIKPEEDEPAAEDAASETSSASKRQLMIPLHTGSFVGSKGGEGLIWRFELPEKELGIIEVEFPEETSDEDALHFEQSLVYNGFLKTGISSDADDIARSIRETAKNFTGKIMGKSSDTQDNTGPATSADGSAGGFSDISKDVIGDKNAEQKSPSAGEKAKQISANLGGMISGAATSATGWFSKTTGLGSPLPPGTMQNTNPDNTTADIDSTKTLPSEVTIKEPTTDAINQLKRINGLLLPVSYPDKFYNEILSEPKNKILTRVAYYNDECIGGIRCRLEEEEDGDQEGGEKSATDEMTVDQLAQQRAAMEEPDAADTVEGTGISLRNKTRKVYIMSLAVLSPYRRLSVGKHLVQYIVDTAAKDPEIKAGEVYAHVWVSNEDGIEFYKNLGFDTENGEVVSGYYKRLKPDQAKIVQKMI